MDRLTAWLKIIQDRLALFIEWIIDRKKYVIPLVGLSVIIILSIALILSLIGSGSEEKLSESVFSSNVPELKISTGFEEIIPIRSMGLYFSDESGIRLVRENRDVEFRFSDQNNGELAQILINELIFGPQENNIRIVPKKAKLHRCFWGATDKTLYLDFNHSFLTKQISGTHSEWLMIRSILKTIECNLPIVRQVQFIIDGKPVNNFDGTGDSEPFGHIDLSKPFPLSG
ncbi:MAG: hypothetical protein B6244_06025 [Candidatus Cloacimonetes bacterium 4572_55]|nr:MAG: hypothetical protein B6244_06025 [Candidatus Cloacimonetes bacterium 4572_55]